MRFCTRLEGQPDEDGVLRDARILDVSFVADDHESGQAPDGTWHWPGGPVTLFSSPPSAPAASR